MSSTSEPGVAAPPIHVTTSAPPPSAPHDDASLPDLLRTLTEQGTHLASQQVALVKAEVTEGINDLKIGMVAMIGATVVGIAALGVFLMALGHLLGMAIGDEETVGWGLLIVAVVTLVIAYVMYQGAAKKLSATNLAPERTQHTLERTPDAAAGNL